MSIASSRALEAWRNRIVKLSIFAHVQRRKRRESCSNHRGHGFHGAGDGSGLPFRDDVMRKFLLLLLCAAPLATHAQTPGLYQSGSSPNTYSESTTILSTYFYLNQPSVVGNCENVVLQIGNASITSPSVTDDGSNTYTVQIQQADTTNGNTLLWATSPIGTASKKIAVSWTGGAADVQPLVAEGYNIPPANCSTPDKKWSNATSSTSTSVNAGAAAQTPANNGDLLIMVASETSSGSGSNNCTAGTGQSNIAWELLPSGVQQDLGYCGQWGVQTTAASINPVMTWGTASDFVAGALAFKAGSSGSAPPSSGNFINGLSGFDVDNYAGNDSSSLTEHMQVAGNLVVWGLTSFPVGYDIKSISCSPSCGTTPAQIALKQGTSNSGDAALWYACISSPGEYTFTINEATGGGGADDNMIAAFDVSGSKCPSNPICDSWGGTISSVPAGTFTALSSMSPCEAGDLFVAVTGEASWGINGVTGNFTNFYSGSFVDSSSNNQCVGAYAAPNPFWECDGFASVIAPSTSALSLQWKTNSIAPGDTVSVAAAIEAGSGGATPLPPTNVSIVVQ
jgi:hypothetical protein